MLAQYDEVPGPSIVCKCYPVFLDASFSTLFCVSDIAYKSDRARLLSFFKINAPAVAV
jgi:hypothetical protein